ncbi:2Fe-2S iron-sulfur cluster-binding protein [Paenibacillus alvei]|uniref:2Fe-2S iron-sulfur cluster binding domain-containing protein n=1 Tax=Paenibacillus alvei TaxID=44250 RepID=A0AAP7DGV5_PAEAL|nr:2Fe-2S iron-sulfur cluster-binding protein [Paenibacillus alvei]MBG9736056.1 ferredoxin [Paenibacillus alvei]MBG9743357.1 ferredoxin [Paenibacillus alvei]MCY9579371.1 2Fe-2S iron-sulfur cluster-binding protein [Paenibacillus alvei]MCY9586021.1 2Fe-2S iron-sulfur cluster-binding protein [Paenibacillus alvei]NOJ69051.1 2Fe-2S iron-sulfur cluster binding domain-containing protein [Paenibacillus alvei]
MGTIVRFEPSGKVWEVKRSMTVLDAARRAGVAIRTRCSGKAGCLLCKVNVAIDVDGILGEPTLAECNKLGISSPQGLRLSCQTLLTGKTGTVTVEVPEDPLKELIRRKLAEQEEDRLW